MKKTILIFSLFLLGSAALMAQQDMNNKKMSMPKNTQMDHKMMIPNVSQWPEASRMAVAEITKKYGLKMRALKNSDEPKRSKFKSMKSIKNDKNAEMKTLLSDEQYKAYIELQEERMAKLKDRKNK